MQSQDVPGARVYPQSAVEQDGVKTRVTEHDFEHTFCSRILAENGVDLLSNRPKHSVLSGCLDD